MGKKRINISYPNEIDKFDDVIKPFLHPDFFFINIGACDGVVGDPVYPLARKYHWKGIAVEPVPYNFERLRKNYQDEPQVIVENAAISTEPLTFWYVDEGSTSRPHVVNQMGSLDRDHLVYNLGRAKIVAAGGSLRHGTPHFLPEYPPVELAEAGDEDVHDIDPDIESFIKGIDIPCLTITELLEKHNVTSVDLLNIDAEGFDYEIFCMIDFSVIRPSIICIETTSFDDDVSSSLEADLARENYQYVRRFGLFSKIYVQAG